MATKRKKTADRPSPFAEIASGLSDAILIAKGGADPKTFRAHIPETVDVTALRKSLKLTQEQFAGRFGFTVGRVRDWEQKRYAPDDASRAYLRVIEKNPKAVEEALSS